MPVLNDISFNVPKGKLCGLFGPNGSGKTTLFKCCLQFLKYSTGHISINGKDVGKKSVKEMARVVSYVPQEHKPPFPYLVEDVVLMGRTPHLRGGMAISGFHKRKVFDSLKLVGIADIANKPYNQLSGGQRQLVLIARAVAQETPLLFLDEPTSALDFSNQIKIWNILKMITEKGTTIVACTHDPNHVLWFCNDVIVLGNRGLIVQGPPRDALSEKVLERIYADICRLEHINKAKIVLPKNIANYSYSSAEEKINEDSEV